MRCQEFREMMDSYLSSELLVETNHEVLRHLEDCAACRSELAARRELLARMRSAVKNAPEMFLNPAFAAKLRSELRETTLRPTVWEKLKSGAFVNLPVLAATVAACLLVGVLFGAIWLYRISVPENTVARQNQAEKSAETAPQNEPNTEQTFQIAWREMIRKVIGDHENCALHFQLAEKPITLEAAAEKYGQFNKNLDKAVIASLQREVSAAKDFGKAAGKIEFYDAHSCVYNGRRFTHVELRNGKKTISVLVTDADLLDKSDGATINETAENFQVAHFRTARHAIFVVSDLSEQENLRVAEMLSPAVRRHIERAEA